MSQKNPSPVSCLVQRLTVKKPGCTMKFSVLGLVHKQSERNPATPHGSTTPGSSVTFVSRLPLGTSFFLPAPNRLQLLTLLNYFVMAEESGAGGNS